MIWWYALALALWGGVGFTSATPRAAFGQVNHTAGYQMSRKSCIASGVRGSCMWVQDCNRSGGKHAGVCVDGFMFGSCCMLPDINESGGQRKPSATLTENPYQMPSIENLSNQPQVDVIIKPNPTQRPSFMTKPLDGGTLNYRPPQLSLPLLSGSVDIKEQSNLSSNTYVNKYDDGVDTSHKVSSSPQRGTARPIPTNTLQDNEVDDSINSVHRLRPNINMNSIWQGTTEPTFITKSRPANWEKPEKPNRPKPTKKFTTTTSKSVTWKPYQKPTSKPIKPVKIPQIPDDGTTTNRVTQADVNEMTESSVLFTTSVATTVECGVATLAHRPETRIVGGKDATFGKWPWQVSVRRTSFLGFSSTHRCGGAILSEGWIATAGHCVDDLLTSQIRIRVGEYDFSSDDEKYPYVERGVSKKAVHPKYNFFTYEYDLALVKLESDLVFSPHIAPICLPASDDSLVGRNATVTGWGRLAEGGTLPSVLQEVQVPIVSNERCKSMFLRAGRKEYIPDIFLCAGHERGGHDSCQGDSGGPLQVKGRDHRYFLAGIISWGIGCAEANLPGVCTRISKFVPWILKTVNENTTISTPPAAS